MVTKENTLCNGGKMEYMYKGKPLFEHMLLDRQTPPCVAWPLAQSIPVAFSHCAMVWKPVQWTWHVAKLCSLWRLTPRLRFGTATADCGKDEASPAQTLDQGTPCAACMSPTLTCWKRLPRAQRLSDLPVQTFWEAPSFCFHPHNSVGQLHRSICCVPCPHKETLTFSH